jgi:glycosyltransferase involved in cell wall biosynthesis
MDSSLSNSRFSANPPTLLDETSPKNLSNQSTSPMLSFGVPIRNSEKFLPRLLDSLLVQNFQDFEIIISDNASEDRTEQICRDYAARDSRVKYYRNEENIGQNPNFFRVLELAQGKYFRWIGDDDWIEKDYASRCIETLEANQKFIGVTTYQDHIFDDGERVYLEYTGQRLESSFPHVRYRRMLWFMSNHYGFIDPIYTMMRRDALMKTHRTKESPDIDQILSVELSLIGPFTHIPACLSHRRRIRTCKEKRAVGYYVGSNKVLTVSALTSALDFWETTQMVPLSEKERFFCLISTIELFIKRLWKRSLPGKNWRRITNQPIKFAEQYNPQYLRHKF